ncbi:MAG: methylglyoxal synthase [Actinomycetota bacterium]|nr:methylglyoxal synthase [Actinomycetota bacterium]
MELRIVAKTGHPDFLDLPWHLPLEEWQSDRLLEVPRGLSRHVVRFVGYDDVVYAIKELPEHLAEREYRLLPQLTGESIPVVDAVGVVSRGPQRRHHGGSPESNALLITRHLRFSQPYRTLFSSRGMPELQNQLIDALAELLVRLHLGGFFWGDCSLSNALFRRDAGALAAYLVDAETGELHKRLSDGQRQHDLTIAEENVAGELMDLEGARGDFPYLDPVETANKLRRRYESLWCELTREEVFASDERYRIDARLRRLNELGFDVAEVQLLSSEEGVRLELKPHVVEPGHHSRRLKLLAGIDAQENQARRLLNDMASLRAHLERTEKRKVSEVIAGRRWLAEVFIPTIGAIPPQLRMRIEAAEAFHEILEHRWFLSEAAGRDIGLSSAVGAYVDSVLEPRAAKGEDPMTPDPLYKAADVSSVDAVVSPVDAGLQTRKRIALVAHDNKKRELRDWATFNQGTLAQHEVYATGTTAKVLQQDLGLNVTRLQSGPLGGDQQIGAKISQGEIDCLVFFWDPLEAQPHDPDVKALLRMAVVWNIPTACDLSTADFMISSPLMSGPYEHIAPDHEAYLNRDVAG